MRDPSYIRILEMGPLSEPRAFDLMNMNTSVGARAGLDNPFYSDEPLATINSKLDILANVC